MPGNSQRRNVRKVSKKGAPKGTGGKGRDTLKGRGKTLPADERPWHKGYSGTEDLPSKTAWKQDKERRAASADGRAPKIGNPGSKDTTWGRGGTGTGRGAARSGAAGTGRGGAGTGGVAGASRGAGTAGVAGAGRVAGASRGAGMGRAAGTARVAGTGRVGAAPANRARVSPGRKSMTPKDAPELLVGRNPVVEALRAHVPGTALYVALGIDIDERVNESVRTAADRGIAILEVSRAELDRLTGGVLHQGLGLQVPPFGYEPFEDLLATALEHPEPLLVALDGVTDPRNLGAVIRSAAAFGAQGVFVPERRAAGITATAWRTSAGAAARTPVAQVTNLTRSLKAAQEQGFVIAGLDADGDVSLYDLEVAVGPLVVVVGSEGRGLSRLVGETCDLRVTIPIISEVESLNASVAAAVALAEISRRRLRPN